MTTNTESINIQKFQIDLEILPDNLKQELWDYYQDLVKRCVPKKKTKKTKVQSFLESVEKHRYDLPEGYKFDRELANER